MPRPSKLAPFEHLFDTLSDEQLAEAAGVQPATVAAYRKKLAERSAAEEAAPATAESASAESDSAAPASAAQSDAAEEAAPDAGAASSAPSAAEALAGDLARAVAERAKGERYRLLLEAMMGDWLAARDDAAVAAATGLSPEAIAELRGELAAERAAPAPASAAPALAPSPREPAPPAVRAVKRARVRGPDGRSVRISRRGVYTGALARWLWSRHRGLVEPYPAA
jgi:hypothetical protein